MKKLYLIIIFAIFLLGAALRAQELITGNFLFLIDQGRDMMAVRNIFYGHHVTLIGPYTSLQGVFQGPFWYYLLSLPAFLFKGNPWGSILMMFTVSMGTLAVVFFWTKKLFGVIAAIFTLFIFSISPEAVAASTYSWNPHPMWFLIAVYIFSFYEIFLKKYSYHVILWPVIAFMFHFETALAVFILLATTIYFLAFGRSYLKKKYFIYGLFVSFLFFLPQIIFELRHDFLMTKSIMNLFAGSHQGLFVKGENHTYLSLVNNHIALFKYNFQTAFVREGLLRYLPGLAFFIMIFAVFAGKRIKLLNKSENEFIFSLVKLISIVILLSLLYPFPIRYWFLTGFQSFYIIIFGIVLSKFWKGFVGRGLILLLVAYILFESVIRLDTLYIHPPDDGGTAKIKGKIQAIDTLYEEAGEKPFNLLIFTPPVNTDAYDYLLWWHGKEKYGFVPTSEKKGVFYLLIDPDPEKPWSYKGWLETVIKKGKVLETKTLPSGLIIQKRVEEKNEL